jgi:predicted HTH transcriptional regulator
MTQQEFVELLALQTELRNVEFKESLNWNDNPTKIKVIKACLCMCNIRDGGFLIIGVREENNQYFADGMSQADLDSFNYDEVLAQVARCADPYVELIMERFTHENKNFIAFTIKEFEEIPVICRGGGPGGGLAVGSLYTRTRRTNESAPVSTQTEMREIIELATNKKLRKFTEQAVSAGLFLPQQNANDDEVNFDQEIEDLLDE